MKSRDLKVSEDLSLPMEAVTETFALLAVKGAGKTNAGRVMAEEMFAAGAPFVVIDPVGSWWGLRAGREPGDPGLPIPIFGGRHGDVPLERGGGTVIADLVVDQRVSCVIDLSDFENEAPKKQFLLDFSRRLYHRNTEPLHLFLEEADDYVPQTMRGATSEKGVEPQLLRAMENIVRRGRARGLGITMITQRSASINKSVLTQAGTLIAMQATSPQDRKAIEDWVKYHGEKEEILASLSSLNKGEAWIWSPLFLGKTVRIRFRLSHTFDSGQTPRLRKSAATQRAATLADVNLEQIRSKMAETIEKAKADDPKELRARIRELEAQASRDRRRIETLERQLEAVPKKQPGRPAGPLHPGTIHDLEMRGRAMQNLGRELEERGKDLEGLAGRLRKETASAEGTPPAAAPASAPAAPSPRPAPPPPRSSPPLLPRGDGAKLGKCEIAVLGVLAQNPDGADKGKLSLLAGYRYSGGFRNSLSSLRSSGLIVGGNEEVMKITDAGLAAADGLYDELPRGEELVAYWLNHPSLGKAERAVLRTLIDRGPMNGQDLAAATGYGYSGGFRNALSALRTAGLLLGKNTETMSVNPDLLA